MPDVTTGDASLDRQQIKQAQHGLLSIGSIASEQEERRLDTNRRQARLMNPSPAAAQSTIYFVALYREQDQAIWGYAVPMLDAGRFYYDVTYISELLRSSGRFVYRSAQDNGYARFAVCMHIHRGIGFVAHQ